MTWKNDSELFHEMRAHLFSAVIGDVLDLHDFHHQFLMPQCVPLDRKMVVCGRAMTVLEKDCETTDLPFGQMLKALDSLKRDEVYIAAGCSPQYALWGELMSTAARMRGAAGAVLAGYIRDTNGILEMKFSGLLLWQLRAGPTRARQGCGFSRTSRDQRSNDPAGRHHLWRY